MHGIFNFVGNIGKSIGNLFVHAGQGIGHVWDQVVNKNVVPALSVAVHAVGGAVTGAVIPALSTYLTSGGTLTLGGIVPVAVGALVGAVIGAAKQSPNQVIASLASHVTPAQINQADQVITQKITEEVAKTSAALNPAPKTGK